MSGGVEYSELVFETKAGIPIDFGIYKQPSNISFSIRNSKKNLKECQKKKRMQDKILKKVAN